MRSPTSENAASTIPVRSRVLDLVRFMRVPFAIHLGLRVIRSPSCCQGIELLTSLLFASRWVEWATGG